MEANELKAITVSENIISKKHVTQHDNPIRFKNSYF